MRRAENQIVDLNTIEQLFDKGENKEGVSLEDIGGEYSPFTIARKRDKGLPTDRVTLFDSGNYYDTYQIQEDVDYFIVRDDPIKAGGINILDRWGKEVVGLSKESRIKLAKILRPYFIEYTRDVLFGR